MKIEILSDVESGVGTRFRKTRLMQGTEATIEAQMTEFVENGRVRIVANSHGTLWDTLTTVEEVSGQTELTMDIEERAYKMLPRLMNPFVMSSIRKALEMDMDSVKEYCEARGQAS